MSPKLSQNKQISQDWDEISNTENWERKTSKKKKRPDNDHVINKKKNNIGWEKIEKNNNWFKKKI